jgi:hypothetical protein
VTALGWIIVIVDIGLAVDAGRRPASAWAAADRKKSYWVPMLAIFGILFVVPYLIGVLPRLNEAARHPVDSAFEKRQVPVYPNAGLGEHGGPALDQARPPASPYEKR